MAKLRASEASVHAAFDELVEENSRLRHVAGASVPARALIERLQETLEKGGSQAEIADECEPGRAVRGDVGPTDGRGHA